MDSSPAPGSPMVDSPICDSDEEVFCGPVTDKELRKASKLKRRTQLYFPKFNWKSSSSVPVSKFDSVGSKKEACAQTVKPQDLSLSADSLETPSFVSLSDKPEDSSKGEFWSARSGNSSGADSETCFNQAAVHSKFSEDSLEASIPLLLQNSNGPSLECGKDIRLYPNLSVDSLDDNPLLINADRYRGNNFVVTPEITVVSSNLSSGSELCPLNTGKLTNATYTASENSSFDDSIQCLNMPQTVSTLKQVHEPDSALTATYEVLPHIDGNNTYTVEDESGHTDDSSKKSFPKINVAEGEAIDKDGGYLAILSEVAMYHAAQQNEKTSHQPQFMEESSSTTQSLEDRFKDFGIDAAELEDQLLTTSIMYETGRESNILSSETQSNSYYTGQSSGTDSFSVKNSNAESCHTTNGNLGDVSSLTSLNTLKSQSMNAAERTLGTSFSSYKLGDVLNQVIPNGSIGSAASTYQGSEDNVILDNSTGNKSLDPSSIYAGDDSELSGVCELHSVSGNHSSDSIEEVPLHNDSRGSSPAGEMNDTLEEYEMMMRYGVDYILGKKGNGRKSTGADNIQSLKITPSNVAEYVSSNSQTQNTGTPSKSYAQSQEQHPSVSSSGDRNATESTQSPKKTGNAHTYHRKILSPLPKQVKSLPHKSSSSIQKCPSKLPRVFSAPPSKTGNTAGKSMQTPSPQHNRIMSRPASETKLPPRNLLRPITPSSESKLGLFKKPNAPVNSTSRIPKSSAPPVHGLKPNVKVLDNIQSPVGAYIHNTPSPVLVTNFKAKTTDRPPLEKEMLARALWRAGEVKSNIPRLGATQASNAENVNPNVGCGLPAVKYTKAPCVKLDENTKMSACKAGEKMSKLLDSPSPQVIKHEGRVRVKCGSPQLAAKMQSVAHSFDDSLIDIHSVSGDISVCVSQQACRTDTLGH